MFATGPFLKRMPVALGLALLIGCAAQEGTGPGVQVTGQVMRRGQPVTGGVITFHSVANPARVVSGQINPTDGSFRVGNVPVGECKVCVDTRMVWQMMGNNRGWTPRPPAGFQATHTTPARGLAYVPVPINCTRVETTPLRVTVERGGTEARIVVP